MNQSKLLISNVSQSTIVEWRICDREMVKVGLSPSKKIVLFA